MNPVDLVLLLILAAYGIAGYFRGFLLGFASVFSLAFTLVVTWLLYRPVSEALEGFVSPDLAPAAAFLGLLVLTYTLLMLALRPLVHRLPKSARKSPLNRAFGIVPGLVDGAVMLVLGLVILIMLAGDRVPRDAISEAPLGGAMLKVGLEVQQAAMEVFGGAVRALVPYRTQKPAPGESVKLPFHTEKGEPNPEMEKAMLELVNRERTERGLPALKWDDRLREVARGHSRDMLKRGYFAHNSPEGKTVMDRVVARELRFQMVGENLALAPTLSISHQGLMDSPGHRANILHDEFTRVGIGAIEAPPYGIMFTQVFAK
jgi:uncharacterized protein YkwD/uncharacterized membrane protein required for colicin V production